MPRPGRPTTERAKNFKGTLRQLIRTMSHYKLPLTAAMLFAILSTIFNIAGPKVLQRLQLYSGLADDRPFSEGLLRLPSPDQ